MATYDSIRLYNEHSGNRQSKTKLSSTYSKRAMRLYEGMLNGVRNMSSRGEVDRMAISVGAVFEAMLLDSTEFLFFVFMF